MQQLQSLKPAKHELLQLNSIRATALACQRPLNDFLAKISKFDKRLSTLNTKNHQYAGFHRRLQWSLFYKEDIKELRSILGSHIATINLLLLTQTVGSIVSAENNRESSFSELEHKISANSMILESVDRISKLSFEHQSDARTTLHKHHVTLVGIEQSSAKIQSKIDTQNAIICNSAQTVSEVHQKTTSVLSVATKTLMLTTLGMMSLRRIAEQLRRVFELLTHFTTDMRTAMAELMQLFCTIRAAMNRLELGMSKHINLPIIKFTDALGDPMALPYQVCQNWSAFNNILKIIFMDKPGKSRVDMGQFLIMQARGGRLLQEANWKHQIKQNDELLMSIVIDELDVVEGHCPYPSCNASVVAVEPVSGGKTCPKCGRWAVSKLRDSRRLIQEHHQTRATGVTVSIDDFVDPAQGDENEPQSENIELYRQIAVVATPAGDLIFDASNEILEELDVTEEPVDSTEEIEQKYRKEIEQATADYNVRVNRAWNLKLELERNADAVEEIVQFAPRVRSRRRQAK